MSGRRIVVGLFFAAVALTTACDPTFVAPAPSTPCYVGTFTLKDQQFTASIPTPVGPETISLVPGGSVVLATTDGTWSLALNEQLNASGAFVGVATVQGTVSGTFTAANSAADFTVTALSGSAHIVGTVSGRAVDFVAQLPGSIIDEAIGLRGHASYDCGDGLTLTFAKFR